MMFRVYQRTSDCTRSHLRRVLPSPSSWEQRPTAVSGSTALRQQQLQLLPRCLFHNTTTEILGNNKSRNNDKESNQFAGGQGLQQQRLFSTVAWQQPPQPPSTSVITIRLYRILQRQCLDIQKALRQQQQLQQPWMDTHPNDNNQESRPQEHVVTATNTSTTNFAAAAAPAAAEFENAFARELQQQKQQQQQQWILLQPAIGPHQTGISRILNNVSRRHNNDDKVVDTTENLAVAVLRLFYVWNSIPTKQPQQPSDAAADAALQGTQNAELQEWFRQVVMGSSAGADIENWNEENYETLWVTVDALRAAIKLAFRRDLSNTNHQNNHHRHYHKWAIKAHQMLADQYKLFVQNTSTCTEHAVRITATSQWIGRSVATNHLYMSPSLFSNAGLQQSQQQAAAAAAAKAHPFKYRFAYRIRIENLSTTDTVQLLGRTWAIYEYDDSPTANDDNNNNSSSSTQQQQQQQRQAIGEPIRVDAPHAGAVGKLPVLQPGQVFVYQSAAEIITSVGEMKGAFHFATVPANTVSAELGMPVAAFTSPHQFVVPVQPFPLQAE